ncbi:hypothetical protein ACQEU5_12715 [Marinactinospora thermotolerans]|uniref:Uncharacterized protein n=1 Tax=Marinactinospora thermotolerans DSM 45154 TaxID=1122192 RepID=A0A1T4SC94_9ACTN|nr:hypothetical protein [Marinactinospora thermotolerans]SKA25822.1 hypothetical protein SAMN02745673_03351 [Marinactinospora thermotolerans DSM 45154]
MLFHELVNLQKTVDDKRERRRQRLTARGLRVQLREQRRAERALMEMRFSRLC